ncbi:MAG: hypothetical protein ACFE9Q_07865 [Candidatus Hodarchaeota archaeon]
MKNRIMKKLIRKLRYRKYKKEALIKQFEEEKLRNPQDFICNIRGQGCGLGR